MAADGSASAPPGPAFEAASPALIRIEVARRMLDMQVAAAQRILAGLRDTPRVPLHSGVRDVPAGRADSRSVAEALIA